jgi:hypothetical protein
MRSRHLLPLLLASASAACTATADMSVKYAAGFAPAGHKVSVLGVYKDGRMDSEAWGSLGPKIGSVLGGRACDAAYGGAVLSGDKEVTRVFTEYATANGLSDDLLAQVAPAATGDLVLVVTVAGHTPKPTKYSVVDQGKPPPGGGGSAYGPRGAHHGKDLDLNELQMAAQLFSVADNKTVAIVNLDYTGQSVDEARAKFLQQLGESLPSSQCVGWNADTKLDADKIRALDQ